MNNTLFRYIGLDLLKATGLTLIVLTLTLTTLGIIEPLRKEGLDAHQALVVFVVTMPVMLSFTLPFAALFAACFVYGRFSQDNELLASRASGISTLTILRPAIVLGFAVTLASLSLSNWLAPIMARKGTEVITNNIRGLMCRKLAVRGFLGYQDMTIHADRVERYPDRDYDKLLGVVVVKRTDKSGHVEIMAAKSARARFGLNHATHIAFANLTLDEPVLMSSDNPSVRTERTASIDSVSFDRRIKEKPAWYSSNELLATLADPSRSITVQQAIPRIQQAICNDIFARHITNAFLTAGGYEKFTSHNERYIITAPKASADSSGRIVLGAGGIGNAQLVEITEIRNGRPAKKATATSGEIKITWDKFTKKPEVSIVLDKDVRSRDLTVSDNGPASISAETTRKVWRRGQISIPKDIRAKLDKITPHEAYHNGGKGGGLTDNPAIHSQLDILNSRHVVQLQRDIKSEIHMRLAFNVSCLLMVMLGGVLGLIFRGGQFVSALVTATLPATTVIATIRMGKNIARNPDVLLANSPDGSIFVGLTIIWGGIIVLAIVTGLTYWKVSRK